MTGLKLELMSSQGHINKLKSDMHFRDEQLKRKTQELYEMNNKVKVCISLFVLVYIINIICGNL